MHATPVQNAIKVIDAGCIEGTHYVTVPCEDYDAFRALPDAVTFEGRTLGKTGWNSDRGVGYYQSNARLAYKVG
jgi:hypothetical protein